MTTTVTATSTKAKKESLHITVNTPAFSWFAPLRNTTNGSGSKWNKQTHEWMNEIDWNLHRKKSKYFKVSVICSEYKFLIAYMRTPFRKLRKRGKTNDLCWKKFYIFQKYSICAVPSCCPCSFFCEMKNKTRKWVNIVLFSFEVSFFNEEFAHFHSWREGREREKKSGKQLKQTYTIWKWWHKVFATKKMQRWLLWILFWKALKLVQVFSLCFTSFIHYASCIYLKITIQTRSLKKRPNSGFFSQRKTKKHYH